MVDVVHHVLAAGERLATLQVCRIDDRRSLCGGRGVQGDTRLGHPAPGVVMSAIVVSNSVPDSRNDAANAARTAAGAPPPKAASKAPNCSHSSCVAFGGSRWRCESPAHCRSSCG